MMFKGKEVRKAFEDALGMMTDSIKGTYGNNARFALVSRGNAVRVLNDGVNILRSLSSDDPATNSALILLKQVAFEAQQASGDGTTTATLLANAIYEGFTDMNRTQREEAFAELEKAKEKLTELSTMIEINDDYPEKDYDKIKTIAKISANNDDEIGSLIADMFIEIGADGLVNLKVNSENYSRWELATGVEIPNGYVSPMMCNTPKRTVEYENPLFLLTMQVIEDFDDLTPALEIAIENNRPLVIFCVDIKGVALSNLVANVVGGVVKACAIRVPRTDAMEWYDDVQSIVGGKIFVDGDGQRIVDCVAGEGQFGSAERITVTDETTVVIAGQKSESFSKHINGLKERSKETSHSFTKEKLLTRIARLDTKMASIYIGGYSEAEIREARERVDDAVNATRLALKGGYVVGAGDTLVTLMSLCDISEVRQVLMTPLVTLYANAERSINDYTELSNGYYLNLKTNEMVHKTDTDSEHAVLDPTLVLVNAITSAISIARLALNTDTIIIEDGE